MAKKELKGIMGWLLFFVICLLGSFIINLSLMIQVPNIFSLFFLIMIIISSIFLIGKLPYAIKITKFFLIGSIFLICFYIALYANLGEHLISLLASIIGLGYFYDSKRVKNTYTS